MLVYSMSGQYVDPAVSEQKFQNELDRFIQSKSFNRKRGIFLLDAEYPNIFIGFFAQKLIPASHVFTVKINFDNYDFEPPSIVFVNPFTFEPIQHLAQVGIPFLRKVPGNPQGQMLLQQNENRPPFLCIPGVREYHHHPAHTGDSWFLHRQVSSEGSLGYLVEKLYQYGISPLAGYQLPPINLNAIAIRLDLNLVPE